MSIAVKGLKSQGDFAGGQTRGGHNVPAPWSMRGEFDEEIGLRGPRLRAASTPIRRHREQQEGAPCISTPSSVRCGRKQGVEITRTIASCADTSRSDGRAGCHPR